MSRRGTPITFIFALLIALGWFQPTAAQSIKKPPTDCTEAITVGTIFIGHDCGEWASVLISGNIIIHKPWSSAIAASRAVRLRARREGSPVTASPTPAPDHNREPASDPLDGPRSTSDPLDGPPPSDGGTTTEEGRRGVTSRSSSAARQRPSRPSSPTTATRPSS